MAKSLEQDPKGWFNRNVAGLAINRFLSDFGHEAGTAILPLFLTAVGAPAFALGVVEGVADALSSFSKLFGGWLGDRVHRRREWAAAGYLLTGLTTGLYGLFAWWPWVLVVRTIGWAGRGLRSPLHDALLTDSVPDNARGRAFGFDEAADTAGAVAGPLLALGIVGTVGASLATSQVRFNLLFALAAVPGVLAALSILALVKEQPHGLLERTSFAASLRLLPPGFRRYLVSVFVFGCGDYSHTMLILYATQSLAAAYGGHAGAIAIGLYAMHNFLYAVGSFPAGVLADRFGKSRFLIVAYALAAVMNLLLVALSPSLSQLVAAFTLAGAGYALQQSLERAIAADLTPPQVRSTGFGVLAAANGLGDFVSSALVGLLWSTISSRAGFACSLVLTTLGSVLMLRALAGERVATPDAN